MASFEYRLRILAQTVPPNSLTATSISFENSRNTSPSLKRLSADFFFEQQLESAKNKLADAEEALTQTEQRTGLIQLDSQTRALIESSASLKAQIAAKQVQIDSLQTFATDENAQLVQARQELQGLQEQSAKTGGDL